MGLPGRVLFFTDCRRKIMENKGKKKAVQGTIYHLTKQYYSGLWMIMIFLMKNPEK